MEIIVIFSFFTDGKLQPIEESIIWAKVNFTGP